MSFKRITLLAVGISVLFVGAADALTLPYGPYSISLASTDWSDTVSVPKFDPAYGTLQSIEFTLEGHVEGSAKFESLDEGEGPHTITMDLKAEIELQRPDTTILVVTIPLAQTVDNVGAYDGTFDWGGTSGKTYSSLSADKTENSTSPPPSSDLTLFTGTGNIVLPVEASGTSAGSGGGNLATQFATSASAQVSVVYTYIPEPASLSLLGLGSLALLRRRMA